LKLQLNEEWLVLHPWKHRHGAPCIRSVFNVSFSHRFMVSYLTQIWSIYVRSSPHTHFNPLPPSTDNFRVPLSLGCETRLRDGLSGTLISRFYALALSWTNSNINNRSRSSFERRFRTWVTNRDNFFITYARSMQRRVFAFSCIVYHPAYCAIRSRMLI